MDYDLIRKLENLQRIGPIWSNQMIRLVWHNLNVSATNQTSCDLFIGWCWNNICTCCEANILDCIDTHLKEHIRYTANLKHVPTQLDGNMSMQIASCPGRLERRCTSIDNLVCCFISHLMSFFKVSQMEEKRSVFKLQKLVVLTLKPYNDNWEPWQTVAGFLAKQNRPNLTYPSRRHQSWRSLFPKCLSERTSPRLSMSPYTSIQGRWRLHAQKAQGKLR